MLSRSDVSIYWFGWNCHKIVCPIPKKVFDCMPISEDVNYSAVSSSLESTISPDNLRQAINYELDLRKKYCMVIREHYDDSKDSYANLEVFFRNLGVNPGIHRGHAWNIYHYSSICNLDKEMGKLEHFHRLYFGSEDYFSSVVGYLKGIPLKYLLPRLAFVPEPPVFDGVNLFWFRPEEGDFRNIISVSRIAGFEFHELNVLKNDYHEELVYLNHRPIESFHSAIIGRDLMVYYLNELLKK